MSLVCETSHVTEACFAKQDRKVNRMLVREKYLSIFISYNYSMYLANSCMEKLGTRRIIGSVHFSSTFFDMHLLCTSFTEKELLL